MLHSAGLNRTYLNTVEHISIQNKKIVLSNLFSWHDLSLYRPLFCLFISSLDFFIWESIFVLLIVFPSSLWTLTVFSLKIKSLPRNTAFMVRIHNLYIISQLSLFIFNMILFLLLYHDEPDFGDPEKKALIILALPVPFLVTKHLAGEV